MLSLTKNYRLEDLLLEEATKAENSGDYKLAEEKLSDALKPYTTKRNDAICAESISTFIDEWSGLDDLVNVWNINGSIYTRSRITRNKTKRRILRKLRKEEEK
jgi:hypothetical protein|tara:strand:- start:3111 stop:3419 length:309 start_codon:yes stop_codon:yes gene_type:complete